jgi:hypothetical protein
VKADHDNHLHYMGLGAMEYVRYRRSTTELYVLGQQSV